MKFCFNWGLTPIHILFRSLLLVALAAAWQAACAQFPSRAVRIIVPFGAGGPTDIVARLLAHGLTEAWKQPVVVENRPGAGGNIGTDFVAKSAPDGHVLAMVPAGPIVVNRWLFEKMPFDPQKDLAPVSQLTAAPLLLYVSAQLPVTSLAELIRYAREHPGKLNFTSAGTSSMPHLAGEMFKRQAQIDIVHVPYKGAPQAGAAVMSGEGAMTFDTMVSLAHVKSGRMRALAISNKARHGGAPDVPTFAEAGMPEFAASAWFGLLAPGATPRELINRIQADAARILLAPEAKARLAGIGFDAVAGSPEAFADLIAAESARWGNLIKAAGIKAE
jgi:tripartite-type tricarboxylate transporter receptor subunit TctC